MQPAVSIVAAAEPSALHFRKLPLFDCGNGSARVGHEMLIKVQLGLDTARRTANAAKSSESWKCGRIKAGVCSEEVVDDLLLILIANIRTDTITASSH